MRTWAIIGVTVAIGVASLVSRDLERFFLAHFALIKPAVAEGDYWRLLTVVLVHGGVLHLAFNMYALFVIGPTVEALYGHVRFALLYALCALGGSAASYAFSDATVSVGASGAIFGLFSVLLVADRVHKPALTRNARNLTTQIGGLILVNLVIGAVSPGIDNAAHIGGLIAGAVLGFVMVPSGPTMASFWTNVAGTQLQAGLTRLGWLLGTLIVVGVVAMLVVAGPGAFALL